MRDQWLEEACDSFSWAVEEIELLHMPSRESLGASGVPAEHFSDDVDKGGGLLLAPAHLFSDAQITAARRAGGRIVTGYAVEYPARVMVGWWRGVPLYPGLIGRSDWCGYVSKHVAYALDPKVAAAVFVASHLEQYKEE